MSTRRWRAVLWGATLLAVVAVLGQARDALLPFGIGAVVVYALSPLVDRLTAYVPMRDRWNPVWRRGIAVLMLYLVFWGTIIAAGFALVPIAVSQISQFIEQLPHIVNGARVEVVGWLDEYQRRAPPEVQARVNTLVANATTTLARAVVTATERSVLAVTQTVGVVFGFAIIPFWMFYTLRDRHFIAANMLRAVPPEAREDVRLVAQIMDHLLGRYIRGQLFLGLLVGTSVGVAMTLLSVQLSLGLGLWAGLTEMIPIIGPWLGAIAGLVVVAATDPARLPMVALVYFGVQMLENNLLVPRIQGQAVDIHPAMVIVLLAVAGAVWGFLGLVVVIPVAAILRELFWYADRRLRGRTPEQAFAASHAGGRQEDLPTD